MGYKEFSQKVNGFNDLFPDVPNSKGITFIMSTDLLKNYEKIVKDDQVFILDEFQDRRLEQDYLFVLLQNDIKIGKRLRVFVNLLPHVESELDSYFKSKSVIPAISIASPPEYISIHYMPCPNMDNSLYGFLDVMKQIDRIEKKQAGQGASVLNESVSSVNVARPQHKGNMLVFFSTYSRMARLERDLKSSEEWKKPGNSWQIKMITESFEIENFIKEMGNGSAENKRFMVFVTKIFQSTFTLPDLVYVIDFGFLKRKTFNSQTCCYTRDVTEISKRVAEQRAGRVGRTREGHVFRLYEPDNFDNFKDEEEPEARLNYATLAFLKACIELKRIMSSLIPDSTVERETEIDMQFYRDEWIYKLSDQEIKTLYTFLKEYQMIDSKNRLIVDFTKHVIRRDFQEYALLEFGYKNKLIYEVRAYLVYIRIGHCLLIKSNAISSALSRKMMADKYFDPDGDLVSTLRITQEFFQTKDRSITTNEAIERFCQTYGGMQPLLMRFVKSLMIDTKLTRTAVQFKIDQPSVMDILRQHFLKVYYRNIAVRVSDPEFPERTYFFAPGWKSLVTITDDSLISQKPHELSQLNIFVFLSFTTSNSVIKCDFFIKVHLNDFLVKDSDNNELIIPEEFAKLVKEKQTDCSRKGTLKERVFIPSSIQKRIANTLILREKTRSWNGVLVHFDGRGFAQIVDTTKEKMNSKDTKREIEQIIVTFEKELKVVEINSKRLSIVIGKGAKIWDAYELTKYSQLEVYDRLTNNTSAEILYERVVEYVNCLKRVLPHKQSLCSEIEAVSISMKQQDESKENVSVYDVGKSLVATLNFRNHHVAKEVLAVSKELPFKASTYSVNIAKFNMLELKPYEFVNRTDFVKMELQWTPLNPEGSGTIFCLNGDSRNEIFSLLQQLKERRAPELTFSFKRAKNIKIIDVTDIKDRKMGGKEIRRLILERLPNQKLKFNVNCKFKEDELRSEVYWTQAVAKLLNENGFENSYFRLYVNLSSVRKTGFAKATFLVRKELTEAIRNKLHRQNNLIGTQRLYCKVHHKLFYNVKPSHFNKYLHFLENLRVELEELLKSKNVKLNILRLLSFDVFFVKRMNCKCGNITWNGNKYRDLIPDCEGKTRLLENLFKGSEVSYNPTVEHIQRKILDEVDRWIYPKYKDAMILHLVHENKVIVFGPNCDEIVADYQDRLEKVSVSYDSVTLPKELLLDQQSVLIELKNFLDKQEVAFNATYEIVPTKYGDLRVIMGMKRLGQLRGNISSEFRAQLQSFLKGLKINFTFLSCQNCDGYLDIKMLSCEHQICHKCFQEHMLKQTRDLKTLKELRFDCQICSKEVLLADIQRVFCEKELVKSFEVLDAMDLLDEFKNNPAPIFEEKQAASETQYDSLKPKIEKTDSVQNALDSASNNSQSTISNSAAHLSNACHLNAISETLDVALSRHSSTTAPKNVDFKPAEPVQQALPNKPVIFQTNPFADYTSEEEPETKVNNKNPFEMKSAQKNNNPPVESSLMHSKSITSSIVESNKISSDACGTGPKQPQFNKSDWELESAIPPPPDPDFGSMSRIEKKLSDSNNTISSGFSAINQFASIINKQPLPMNSRSIFEKPLNTVFNTFRPRELTSPNSNKQKANSNNILDDLDQKPAQTDAIRAFGKKKEPDDNTRLQPKSLQPPLLSNGNALNPKLSNASKGIENLRSDFTPLSIGMQLQTGCPMCNNPSEKLMSYKQFDSYGLCGNCYNFVCLKCGQSKHTWKECFGHSC